MALEKDRIGLFRLRLPAMLAGIILAILPAQVGAVGTLRLDQLIAEAQENNPEIRLNEARTAAAGHRIPQAESLQDPMIMFGYQNESFDRLTLSEMPDSQLMFSASQMFPYPGKRALKGEMAKQETASLAALTANARLTTVRVITELFYDLFFAYKNLDIAGERARLYDRLESAASARYGSGMGTLQEVVMAQTEKYMLLETETMQRQKITAVEAILHNAIGRTTHSPLGVPVEPVPAELPMTVDQAIAFAAAHSPAIASRERMLDAAETKIAIAEKEYYPDFTVTGTVAEKGTSDFEDMWSITTSLNIPLYYRTKQREAVSEARAERLAAQQELAAAKLMLTSSLRDNYAMARSADELMELYKTGLIPKAYQDCELALSGYVNGKIEAYAVISRMKNLINYELAYWERFVERGKAVARIAALLGSDGRTEPRQQPGGDSP